MPSVTRLTTGLDQPLFVTSPLRDTARLFVIEQKSGLIKIIDTATGAVSSTPFLQIPSNLLLNTGYEQGLLGLAFHPDYVSNGKFYVNYTATNGTRGGKTKIVEYQVSSNPNVADLSSARDILSFDQPETNHNGGWMAFGPDGFLYISSGDGGGNGYQNGQLDQSFNSQDLTDNKLGKILRIDVNGDAFQQDSTRNYQIPANNPFVGRVGDDEIWSYGLRNPWRPSFDAVTGDLYIADVGQSAQEEVNFQPAGLGGQNYGWNRFEGYLSYKPVSTPETLTYPIYAYNHDYGSSITGGYVYRGPALELQGEYFFGDFATGKIASFNVSALSGGVTSGEITQRTMQFAPPAGQGTINNISSFGEDASRNLYIVDYDGEIFRVNGLSPTPVDTTPPTSALSASGISSVPSSPYTFTVRYDDASLISVNSIDSNDVRVTGPNGYSQLATRVATSPTSNASSVTGTYSISSPGGTWDPTDNGSYQLSLLNNAVTDTFGNATAAVSLGSFAVNIPSPPPLPPTPPQSGTVFLSDLAPTASINGFGDYERDRSNGEAGATDGRTLTLNGTTYAKGLGVHASSTLTYSLGGLYSRFQSFIGIDDETGRNGSVIFRVLADGVEIFRSGILRGDSNSVPVDLDVTGRQSITLIVDTADGSNAYDHANWADAKLLNITPPPSATKYRIEGEAMDTITNYRSENISSASGGKVLSLIGGSSMAETGNASFAFTGDSGKYDLIIGAYDETDGIASFTITKNSIPLGSTTLNRNLESASPIEQTKVGIIISAGIEIRNGDLIGIQGFENGGEHARLDFIDLVKVPLV